MAWRHPGRRHLLALSGAMALPALRPGRADSGAIRIGEVNSATPHGSFVEPYRQGWILAQEALNAAGGVLGRRLETVFRDDAGDPARAMAEARSLAAEEGVSMLAGGLLPEPALALSRAAAALSLPCLVTCSASETLVGPAGNPWTFRLRPGLQFSCAMLAGEAASIPARRWAVVAPDDADGAVAANRFRAVLAAAKPDVEFLEPFMFPRGRLDAGGTVQALLAARPEAMLTLGFGGDLANFVRQGNTRGLFGRIRVASLLAGAPEYLEPLGGEAPEDWIVTGYPWQSLDNPVHARFREAYRARWNAPPRLGSVLGHDAVTAIAAALAAGARGGSQGASQGGSQGDVPPRRRALADAFRDLGFPTVLGVGEVTLRASDRQSTMGVFLGRTALRQGVGVMVDWRHIEARDHLPA